MAHEPSLAKMIDYIFVDTRENKDHDQRAKGHNQMAKKAVVLCI